MTASRFSHLLHFVYATAYLVGAPLGTRTHKLVKRFPTDLSVQDVGKRSVVFLQYEILTDVRMGFSFAALGEPHNVSERSSHIYLQYPIPKGSESETL